MVLRYVLSCKQTDRFSLVALLLFANVNLEKITNVTEAHKSCPLIAMIFIER